MKKENKEHQDAKSIDEKEKLKKLASCTELNLKDFDPIVCCLKQKIATKIVGVSFNKNLQSAFSHCICTKKINTFNISKLH